VPCEGEDGVLLCERPALPGEQARRSSGKDIVSWDTLCDADSVARKHLNFIMAQVPNTVVRGVSYGDAPFHARKRCAPCDFKGVEILGFDFYRLSTIFS